MSATNRGSKRTNKDQYMTPDYSVMSLIENRKHAWDGGIFGDICCGDGEILRRLRANIRCATLGSDIDSKMVEMARFNSNESNITERDALELTYFDNWFHVIVTNPPFSIWMDIVVKMRELAPESWALLRLNCFGAQYRKSFWNQPGMMPNELLILSKRPRFRKPSKEYWMPENYCNIGKGTDATEYAWFGWTGPQTEIPQTRIKVV